MKRLFVALISLMVVALCPISVFAGEMDGDILYNGVMDLTRCFAFIYCILYLEVIVLLGSAIYNVRLKRCFSLQSVFQIVCDLCTDSIAWLVYALHVLLLDNLGLWKTEDLVAIQDRIGIATIGLSVLVCISLVLKFVLLKNRKKQQRWRLSRK